jgi:hypothetical protein
MYLEDKKKELVKMQKFTSDEISIMYFSVKEQEKEWRRVLINANIAGNIEQAKIARNKMTEMQNILDKLFVRN